MRGRSPFPARIKHFWKHFFYFILQNILNQNGYLQTEQGEKNKKGISSSHILFRNLQVLFSILKHFVIKVYTQFLLQKIKEKKPKNTKNEKQLELPGST